MSSSSSSGIPSTVLPATTIGRPAAASRINPATRLCFGARMSYFIFPATCTDSVRTPTITSRSASSSLCASHSAGRRITGPHTDCILIARAKERSLMRAFTTATGTPLRAHSCNMRGHSSLSVRIRTTGFRTCIYARTANAKSSGI